MDSNSNTCDTEQTKLTNEEINSLSKKDKFEYYMSQVDQNLIADWKKLKKKKSSLKT